VLGAGADGAGALDATCDSGCAARCEIGAPDGRDTGTGVDAAREELTGALDIVGVRRIGEGGRSGCTGFAGSGEITPSDSVTVGAVGAAGAVGADGAGPNCSEVTAAADWFCRTAKYEPPAAAARHPTANPAKTSLLNSIAIELLPDP